MISGTLFLTLNYLFGFGVKVLYIPLNLDYLVFDDSN